MARVHDVAQYILEQMGELTTWKLQKLVYYSQAWSLVWEDRPMFGERIEAWANGPVCRELYNQHRGQFAIGLVPGGNAQALDPADRETVDAVLEAYGGLSSQQLSDLTHMERPWRDARGNTPPGERSDAPITLDSMAAYYQSMLSEDGS